MDKGEIIAYIFVFGLVGLIVVAGLHELIEAVSDIIKNERDAIRKYETYGGRLFETVIYRHEIYECSFIHYYKAQLNEIVGKKKINRKTVCGDKDDFIQKAETILLDYLVEEIKAEIKEKTFEKLLDNLG